MTKNIFDIYSKVKKNDPKRESKDFYPTPPLATYSLIKHLGDRMPKRLIEPCAGRGHISAELIRNGFDVRSFDLHSYEDMLAPVFVGSDAETLVHQEDFGGIVTNPPYFNDLPRKLVEKFTTEYDFVAMFLRLTFMEGKKRHEFFSKNPPSDILIMSDRVNAGSAITLKDSPIEKTDQIGGMICYAWFVWNKKALHENTIVKWILLDSLYEEWLAAYSSSSVVTDKYTERPALGTIFDYEDD